MRYSAVQESDYGVGLGQETTPYDVDKSMMAATGDVEPGGGSAVDEGSMISNLPLLFANGYPTSLEKITLPELERFVTFMVQCSFGHDATDVIREPQWWPKEIKFSIPLTTPKKFNESYMGNLKKLVFRCYTYHRSEYLLRFCSYLAQYPHDKLEYVNNWDSTTSLYLKTTGKLLVTFRNENMEYDKKSDNSRRMLLSPSRTKNNTKCLRRRTQKQAPSPAMVEPVTDDIYLCDNCDAEFMGLPKMKEHEKLCYRVEPRPITPEMEVTEELRQDQFMDYFKMAPSHSDEGKKSSLSDKKQSTQNRTSSRIRGVMNLTRCPTIPFSSPLGMVLGKKSKMMSEEIQQERLDRIERHLYAPPLSYQSIKPKWFIKSNDSERWAISYKPNNRDKTVKVDEYCHKYNFGNYKRKPVLDLRSQLLKVTCKPIYVALERQTDEELEELTRDPTRYKTPEREVPQYRPRSPIIEVSEEPAPGDESNPIFIDLEDDEPPTIPSLPQALPIQLVKTLMLPTATVSPMPAFGNHFILGDQPISTPSKTKRSKPSFPEKCNPDKPVVVVDLCSSDDEPTDTDENRDPKRRQFLQPEACGESSFVHNQLISPVKLYSSANNWIQTQPVRRDGFLTASMRGSRYQH